MRFICARLFATLIYKQAIRFTEYLNSYFSMFDVYRGKQVNHAHSEYLSTQLEPLNAMQ